MRKRRSRKPYLCGSLQAAHHATTGTVEVGLTVVARGYPERRGKVVGITRSNHGRGRPIADVLWDDGSTSRDPLGAIKVVG